MKIAAVQPLPDLAMAMKLMETAINDSSDVVMLPEKWIQRGTAAIDAAIDMSSTFNGLIIPGAFEMSGEVRAPIIKGGEVRAWAIKSHLTKAELSRARPGPGPLLVEFRGVKMGIMICYDADFPEIARALTVSGASLFLVPSRILHRGIDMWRIYIVARSLENRVPLVNANALDPPIFMGGSRAVELREEQGIIMAMERVLGGEPGILYYEHGDSLSTFRKERIKELRSYQVRVISI
ncbi:nitrilase [Thermocladium modestius]|uniref:Nitrilase n=1 Tax=Thermocladium modestius TaxID=62609 RepID=A0A830GZW9_9CREN|nr:carbon-nitrogen hydrolase family protein [Thermocladium modestius]GGP22567.1 nitrilase [Thermocladium modestius]